MKFVYIDESGNPSHNPNFIMIGVLIDAYRFSKHNKKLDQKLANILTGTDRNVSELKTHKLINGDSVWRHIPPENRKAWVESFCDFAMECSNIYAIAINFEKFETYKVNNPDFEASYWHVAAMSLSAQIQRRMQKEIKNKGNSFLIFDDNQLEIPKLCDVIHEGDEFYDDVYDYSATKGSRRFDQIINTAFSIKSQHASFIQCADCVAYIYRRHFELMTKNEKWEGEQQYFEGLFRKLEKKRILLGRVANEATGISFLKNVAPDRWKL